MDVRASLNGGEGGWVGLGGLSGKLKAEDIRSEAEPLIQRVLECSCRARANAEGSESEI